MSKNSLNLEERIPSNSSRISSNGQWTSWEVPTVFVLSLGRIVKILYSGIRRAKLPANIRISADIFFFSTPRDCGTYVCFKFLHMYITCTGCMYLQSRGLSSEPRGGKIRYPLDLMRGTREPMGKFVTRLIVVCNVDGAKSANGKICLRAICQAKSSQTNWSQSLNQYTHGYDSSHVGVLKGNPRRGYLCAVFVLCGVGKCIAQQLPIMGGPRLRSVLCGPTHASYVGVLKGKSQESLLACCVSV